MLIRPAALAVPLALLLALAGCGGDDDDETASSATTVAEATTTTQGSGTTSASFTGAGSEEFCAAARSYFERANRAFTADAFAVAANPQDRAARERFRNGLVEASRVGHEIEPKAPGEIRDDFSYLLDAADRYREALEKADYNLTAPGPSALLTEPRFQTATTRFSSYLTDVCKLPVGSTVPGAGG